MLAALRSGRPMSRRCLFEHAGQFFLTNNAASELRARGFDVRMRREKGAYLYWLEDGLTERCADGLCSPKPSAVVGGGNRGLTPYTGQTRPGSRSVSSSEDAGEVEATRDNGDGGEAPFPAATVEESRDAPLTLSESGSGREAGRASSSSTQLRGAEPQAAVRATHPAPAVSTLTEAAPSAPAQLTLAVA